MPGKAKCSLSFITYTSNFHARHLLTSQLTPCERTLHLFPFDLPLSEKYRVAIVPFAHLERNKISQPITNILLTTVLPVWSLNYSNIPFPIPEMSRGENTFGIPFVLLSFILQHCCNFIPLQFSKFLNPLTV